MKKILLIIFCVPLIFSSCEKEDDSPDSNSNNITPPTGEGYINNGGYVYKTTDSGVTWSEMSSPGNLEQMSFVNTTTGYINNGGYVYKTTDSGVTWSEMSSPGNLEQMSFVN